MVNVLLVFIGAGVFAIAVVQQGQGHDWLMDQVQLLWQPLFAPACLLYTSDAADDGESGSHEALEGTAELAMALLDRARRDPGLQRQCREEAKSRLGKAGGGPRMAAAICALLA